MKEDAKPRFDAAEVAVWIVSAVLVGPILLVAAIPLVFVLALLWPILILPVIVAGEYRDIFVKSDVFIDEVEHDVDGEPAHA